jgi:hypothetical protein
MFEEAVILGETEREIHLATHRNNKIKNVVELPPTEADQHKYALFLAKFRRPSWKERKPITGIYNCAGHVWACRRTCIMEPAEWQKILDDDNYRLLEADEVPVPGDVAVYILEDTGDLWHVARVYGLAEGLTPTSSRFPKVISKWGSISGEHLHLAHEDPYRAMGFPCRIAYYTDRPREPK